MKQTINCTPSFIKKLRKSLGLTQEEMAKRLGVSFTSVNRWENGQTQPTQLAKRQIESLYLSHQDEKKNNNLSRSQNG